MNRFKERLIGIMSKGMISCDEASYLSSLRCDRRLRLREWWNLAIHKLSCHLCRKYGSQIKQLNKAVAAYGTRPLEEPLNIHLPGEASQRIRDLVKQEMDRS